MPLDSEGAKRILRGAVQTAWENGLSDDQIREVVDEYVLLLKVRKHFQRKERV